MMGQIQTPTSTGALPLAAHPLFASDDLDEARNAVARVYCDHRLETIGSSRFAARHNRLSGGCLSVNVMTYGTKTLIAPGALERFYLFQFPLSGHASVSNGDNSHEIGGGRSGVLNPDAETRMIWDENCAQLLVQIDRDALNAAAQAEYGLPAGHVLRFQGANDMRGSEGRAFLGLLDFVMREADRGGVMLGSETLLGKQLERTLMVGLLETQAHNLSRASDDQTAPMPRVMRLAESYMRENLYEPIMIEDIARAAGTSVRGLQAAFRARGRSPMSRLRDLRLEQAWEELSNPAPETSVTDVATALGFFHLGRFAEYYRKKFGCSPVETLRVARN
ncbi:AraC family transcriptional regulator [Celeribacter sp. ULVN23_4]